MKKPHLSAAAGSGDQLTSSQRESNRNRGQVIEEGRGQCEGLSSQESRVTKKLPEWHCEQSADEVEREGDCVKDESESVHL